MNFKPPTSFLILLLAAVTACVPLPADIADETVSTVSLIASPFSPPTPSSTPTVPSQAVPTHTSLLPTPTAQSTVTPAPLLGPSPSPTLTTAAGERLAAEEKPPWRIMPLGDSLTSGTYPGRVHSYRGYLETLLTGEGYSFDFVGTQSRLAHSGTDPDHEGHSGFTIGPDDARFCDECATANLYDHLEGYMQSEPDIILLLIGINDLLPLDVRPVDPAEAPGKLVALVQRLQELRPFAHIFVASLAPINYMDSVNLPYYAEINQAAGQLGAVTGDQVYFVDLNRLLTATLDPQTDFADGIHLAEGGARKMAQVWFDALVSSGLLALAAP